MQYFWEYTTNTVCYNVFATCLTVFLSLQRLWICNPGSSCRWNHRESRTSGGILSEQASLPRTGQVLKLEFQHNTVHVCESLGSAPFPDMLGHTTALVSRVVLV